MTVILVVPSFIEVHFAEKGPFLRLQCELQLQGSWDRNNSLLLQIGINGTDFFFCYLLQTPLHFQLQGSNYLTTRNLLVAQCVYSELIRKGNAHSFCRPNREFLNNNTHE